jgi:NAD(P)-dependent dehydrogenase (short-subunit alcohol dehydrogenase family)
LTIAVRDRSTVDVDGELAVPAGDLIGTDDLRDGVVVVTGAVGGIGRAIAQRFAASGATVALLDLDPTAVRDLAGALAADGMVGLPVVTDVADEGSVAAAIAQVESLHGRVDVLCSCAGISDGLKTVEELDVETWERVFAVNARGPFLMTRAVLPGMRRRGRGSIVNIASVAGMIGGASGAAYTASKHAVIGLTRSTAVTYGPEGIRCNAVCPGGVDSGMRIGDVSDPLLSERMTRVRSRIPRRGSPDEVASVVRFLATADSSFVNGAILAADAGWTAT